MPSSKEGKPPPFFLEPLCKVPSSSCSCCAPLRDEAAVHANANAMLQRPLQEHRQRPDNACKLSYLPLQMPSSKARGELAYPPKASQALACAPPLGA